MNLLFGFSGRIGRAQWWLASFAIVLVWVLIIAGFAAFIAVVDPSAEHTSGELSHGGLSVGIALLMGIILSCWIKIAATIKRYHDLDKPGVWLLLTLIPIIGPIWVTIECGFFAGSPGNNDFGPPSGTSDRATFVSDLDAHISRMKAERAGQQQPRLTRNEPQASRMEPASPAPQARRPAGPNGFGRRGLWLGARTRGSRSRLALQAHRKRISPRNPLQPICIERHCNLRLKPVVQRDTPLPNSIDGESRER
ncbi:MAG: DUF805 domain-containing protein [Mesorhizobium sp.]